MKNIKSYFILIDMLLLKIIIILCSQQFIIRHIEDRAVLINPFFRMKIDITQKNINVRLLIEPLTLLIYY